MIDLYDALLVTLGTLIGVVTYLVERPRRPWIREDRRRR